MEKKFDSKSWHILLLIISAGTAFGMYWNALSNNLIWDDPIVLERQVSAFLSAKDIFFPPQGIPEFGGHYYRPLVILSFIIDKVIWRDSPFGFHLSVVIFHAVNTLLVFFLSRAFLKKYEYGNLAALISSLLFAVHPIHTESVDWIAGRSDVLAALFFFPSLLLYVKFKEKGQRHWLLLSSLLFLLACLAKEVSLSLLLLLPVIDIAFFSDRGLPEEISRHERKRVERAAKKKEKRDRKGQRGSSMKNERSPTRKWGQEISFGAYLLFLLVAAIYFIVRYRALGGEAKKVFQTEDILGTLLDLINAYGFYLKKLLLPVNLTAFLPEVPSGTLISLVSTILLLLLLAGLVFSIARKNGIVLFVILFFVITLIPSVMLAVFQIAEIPIAERYLYIPSFSFCLLLGYFFAAFPERLRRSRSDALKKAAGPSRFIIAGVLLIMLVIFSFQTVKRTALYKNDLLFWGDVVMKISGHGLPHLNLGLAYQLDGRLDDAQLEYEKGLGTLAEDDIKALIYNSLGALYLKKNDHERAEESFSKAISLRSNMDLPYYNMAVSYWKRYLKIKREAKRKDRELLEEALPYLDSAVRINPQYAEAHNLYGKVLAELGRYDEAKRHLEAALTYRKEGKIAESSRRLLEQIQ